MSARVSTTTALTGLTAGAVPTKPETGNRVPEQESFGSALQQAQQSHEHAPAKEHPSTGRQQGARPAKDDSPAAPSSEHRQLRGNADRRQPRPTRTKPIAPQQHQGSGDQTAVAQRASMLAVPTTRDQGAPAAGRPGPASDVALSGATTAGTATRPSSSGAASAPAAEGAPGTTTSPDHAGNTSAASATSAVLPSTPTQPTAASRPTEPAQSSSPQPSAPTVTVTSPPEAFPAGQPSAATVAAGTVLDRRAAAADPAGPGGPGEAGGRPASTTSATQPATTTSAPSAPQAAAPPAVLTAMPTAVPTAVPNAVPTAQPAEQAQPSSATDAASPDPSTRTAPSVEDKTQGRLHATTTQDQSPQPLAPQQSAARGADRDSSDDAQPRDPAPQEQPTNAGRGHDAGTPLTQTLATPYSTVLGRSPAVGQGTATAAPEAPEMPATQALPAGTLAQVNGAEHSVRVQLHTDALGRLTADLHTRPGEMAVQLTVPDDAGRALMAQRLDALRDSLGQSGTAVHLSLTAHDGAPDSQQLQGFPGYTSSQGQQGNTPREDGARQPAPSAPQPHDAVTPRATDGSSVLPAPAGSNRLVDVRA